MFLGLVHYYHLHKREFSYCLCSAFEKRKIPSEILPKILIGSFSLFNFHKNMIDSSSPDAKYSPDGDHRTTFTAR